MATEFLHGAKVLEVTSGARPIRTVNSAVIGLVGTAPDADNTAASLALGSGTSALTITAKAAGEAGNAITVALVNPGTNSATLSVSLTGNAITVNLATDGSAIATSTAALVKAALDGNTGIAALVSVVSGGSGVVAAVAATPLSGGLTSANAAQKASAVLGSGTSAVTLTAKTAGIGGNSISVRLRNPGAISSALSVSIAEQAITVNLATDGTGIITSTPALIKTALEGNTDIAALVSVTSGGSGVVRPTATVLLSGGLDEAFPVNTPVLVANNRALAARLGTSGTLPTALDDIARQTGAVIVVVRAAVGADDAATEANIIAAVGILLNAESVLGYVPRVLIAPEFSATKEVADELISVATKLRAFVGLDGPNTTDAAAVNYMTQFGSDRITVIDPYCIRSGVAHATSAAWAGALAKSDYERGFWWSPSNIEILGFSDTARAIPFRLGDSTSEANLLNEAGVTTVIRQNGMRIWGNRSAAIDPTFSFIAVRRTADMVNDSILRAHLWAVDRPITRTYLEDVVEGVNAYLKTLIALGAIIGGECWADPDLNTPANIAQGKVFFNFKFTPPYPAESITFRSQVTNDFLSELTA